ncbi:unnamed protein product [Rotaria socialis]
MSVDNGEKIFMKRKKTLINAYGLSGIFKMIPSDSRFTELCTAFEHSATYDYAKLDVGKKKTIKKDANVTWSIGNKNANNHFARLCSIHLSDLF